MRLGKELLTVENVAKLPMKNPLIPTQQAETVLAILLSDNLNFSPSREDTSMIGEHVFANLITHLIDAEYTINDRKGLYFIIEKYEQGLIEARKNHIGLAKQIFTEADSLLGSFTEKQQFILNAFSLPAKAYLCYKTNQYNEALNYLTQTAQIDDLLEQKGFPQLHFHRLQQLHNITRIYFKQGNFEKGAKLVSELLQQMMFTQSSSIPGSWAQEHPEQSPKELRSAMFYQAMYEMVYNCLQQSKHKQPFGQALHQIAFSGMTAFNASTTDEQTLRNWIWIKEQFAKQDLEIFASSALAFIKRHSRKFDIFKYALLQDLLQILDELPGHPDVYKVEEQFQTYIHSYLHIPKWCKELALEQN